MTNAAHVYTATASEAEAEVLAQAALAARLAAAAQINQVSSLYWHHGELGEAQEWRIRFVTSTSQLAALLDHLAAAHPWTNPELTWAAVTVSQANLRWLDTLGAS